MLQSRWFRVLFALYLIALVAAPLAADGWTRFRGPNGSGQASSKNVPVEIGPEKNKSWEAEVPFGRSSPVVTDDHIFLTAADDGKLLTLAIDRASGKELWRRQVERGHDAGLYKDTDSATPSPVTDGSNVYAFFHEAGLVSYDGAGKERWKVKLGPFRNYYGIASSPVLAGDRLFLLCDQAEGSFLLAVDKDTGKEVWRKNRPARLESYSTPILYPDASSPSALVVAGSRWVDAYDPATGDSVWTLGGVGTGPISSPVLAGDTLVINAHDHADDGWPPFAGLAKEHDGDGDGKLARPEVEGSWLFNHFGWLDADGDGSITAGDWEHMEKELVNDNWGVFGIRVPAAGKQPEILWNYRQNVPYIPSAVIWKDVVYMVKDGIVTSLDLATGKLLERGRLEGAAGKVYASPVVADGKIYIGTLDGKMAVLSAGADWSVIATSDLGEEIWASPAIVDGHLYVRTRGKLYDFVTAAPDPGG
ncbi:MAG: PQQ-binding-like beta-propeller repeat protein [bacterium]|nr:PQQ-binding-like beta-propeller repeat protein [bacterium]